MMVYLFFQKPNTEPYGISIMTDHLCCWLYGEKDCCDSVRLHSNELVGNQGTLICTGKPVCIQDYF